MRILLLLPLLVLIGDPAPAQQPTAEAFAAAVDEVLAGGPDVRASVWLGGVDGEARFARHADRPQACASSIKAAYLVELFATFAERLDEPMPGTAEVLDGPSHPAIAHFTEEEREAIRTALSGATVREIGYAMIRSHKGPEKERVTNAVYNAAANLVTARFGGPEGLTARIHERFLAARALVVRRHMLAARDVTGDNHATAAGLATVWRAVARGDVPGASPETVQAMREVLRKGTRDDLAHYSKGGSLNSHPQCRIASGWLERPEGPLVYAVMPEQPRPEKDAGETGKELGILTRAVRDALLETAAADREKAPPNRIRDRGRPAPAAPQPFSSRASTSRRSCGRPTAFLLRIRSSRER